MWKEQQAGLHLMDDHQNDGDISRSIVWHHPKDIACRAPAIRDIGVDLQSPTHNT